MITPNKIKEVWDISKKETEENKKIRSKIDSLAHGIETLRVVNNKCLLRIFTALNKEGKEGEKIKAKLEKSFTAIIEVSRESLNKNMNVFGELLATTREEHVKLIRRRELREERDKEK